MIALYRKYRPQTFAEVVGQTGVKQTLINAILHRQTVHAYLFSGPRGTGKTTLARIFAKSLNCDHRDPKTAEPCNSCDICISINANSFVDLIEIDAASNRGIDEIRNLKESIRFAPSKRDGFKLYIIDESHMLTKDASNALLKTLEEPPRNIIFILATTDPQKMIPTILSRVQRFDFSSLKASELRAKLEHVIEKEGLNVDPEVINRIVIASMGGARDAESILGKLLTYNTGSTITTDLADQILGKQAYFEAYEIFQDLTKEDGLARSMTRLSDYYEEGYAIDQLAGELIRAARLIFLYSLNHSLVQNSELLPEELDRIHTISQAKSSHFWGSILTVLEERRTEIPRAYLPHLPLELALAEVSLGQGSFHPPQQSPTHTTVSPPTPPRSNTSAQPKIEPKTRDPIPKLQLPESNPFRSLSVPNVKTTSDDQIVATKPNEYPPRIEGNLPAVKVVSSKNDIPSIYDIRKSIDQVSKILAKDSKSLIPLFLRSRILRFDNNTIYLESESSFYKSRLEKHIPILAKAFSQALELETLIDIIVVDSGSMEFEQAEKPSNSPTNSQPSPISKTPPIPKTKEEVLPDLPPEELKPVEEEIADIFKEFL